MALLHLKKDDERIGIGFLAKAEALTFAQKRSGLKS